MKDKILLYCVERMREPSTWRGLVLVVTAFGWACFTDQQEQAITTIGLGLAGLLGVVTPDK